MSFSFRRNPERVLEPAGSSDGPSRSGLDPFGVFNDWL